MDFEARLFAEWNVAQEKRGRSKLKRVIPARSEESTSIDPGSSILTTEACRALTLVIPGEVDQSMNPATLAVKPGRNDVKVPC